MVKVRLNVLKKLHSENSRFHDFSNQGNSPKSLNMRRLRNQRKFELQKNIIYRWKGLEKCYSIMIFPRSLTETIPLKIIVGCYISLERF